MVSLNSLAEKSFGQLGVTARLGGDTCVDQLGNTPGIRVGLKALGAFGLRPGEPAP